MIIYVFWTNAEAKDDPAGIEAHTSLEKAKSARAAMFPKSDRPEILKITLPDHITRAWACKLLMQKDYALHMEDVA